MRVVVNQLPVVGSIRGGVVRIDGAVAAEEAHVVHHGICAGHPFGGDGARIDAVGVEADAGDDVGSVLGSFEERLGTADALKSRSAVGEEDAGDAGLQADENGVGLQRDRVRDAILAGGKINRAVSGDGLAERGGVVGDAIAAGAERADVDPGVHRRERQDVGFDGSRQIGSTRRFGRRPSIAPVAPRSS